MPHYLMRKLPCRKLHLRLFFMLKNAVMFTGYNFLDEFPATSRNYFLKEEHCTDVYN